MDDLTLVPVAVRQHSRLGGAVGCFTAIYEATHDKTGVKGHLLYEVDWEKRDIVDERLYTDNPALFDGVVMGESPGAWLDIHAPDMGSEPDGHPLYVQCGHLVYEQGD